ncbi:MAG: HAMP domain-containing sensor histidine kinase [Bacillota bacterium]|nr:HAMP domain-containing sensor histidine kinase [Bacillota bacterium]
MLNKLRYKFIAVIMLIVTLMLLVAFGLIYNFTRVDLEQASVSMMRTAAQSPPAPGRLDGMRGWEVLLPFFTVRVNDTGELIAEGDYFDLSDAQLLADIVAAAQADGGQQGVLRDYDLRYLRSDDPLGQVIVFADMSSELAALSSLRRTSALIGALCMAVFFAVSILLARWAVKPVELAWRQQRQFVADASHELKTPLTVIITNAELLQGDEGDAAGRARLSENILIMSRHMRSLVERLLDLARADDQPDKLSFARVDLSGLVANGVLPFEALFFERELRLSVDIADGICVKGDQRQLEQVLEILLDNAQKYGLAPGTAQVTLTAHKRGRCLLTVANSGEPLGDDELRNIFRRFYRAESARSRDGSFGLGLSIAKSIVDAHHGRIWAASEAGVNRFHVELATVR